MNFWLFLACAIILFAITFFVMLSANKKLMEWFSEKTLGRLFFIIPLIVAIIGGSLISGSWFGGAFDDDSSGSSNSSRIEDNYGHDEFDAVTIAKKAVKNNLKSPSTVKFCKHSELSISCSGNSWTVKGYVEAQNSFGATIRNQFTVKFTFSSSERYTIDYCNIY